jgi:hypothetical protein
MKTNATVECILVGLPGFVEVRHDVVTGNGTDEERESDGG